MSIELVRGETVARLALTGSTRLDALAELHAKALEATASRDVELDLSRAEYVHAAAIQLLVSLHRTLGAAGRTLHIAAVSPEMRVALERFGLGSWL